MLVRTIKDDVGRPLYTIGIAIGYLSGYFSCMERAYWEFLESRAFLSSDNEALKFIEGLWEAQKRTMLETGVW